MPAPLQRPDTDDLLSLLLTDVPLLDTRAPAEFARGSFPHAVNLPLMNDAERSAVGTCYKQHGQEAAIKLGHRLVQGVSKQQRISGWLEFARQYPDGYLFCFRGGLRSQICQQWMREAGAPYPRIVGGYKAMRRLLLDALDTICTSANLIVVGGQTGCAKTELLRTVPGSIDLEELAHHRGSAFGRRADAQPSQIDFDNALAIALLRHQQQSHQQKRLPLVVEDESRLIGCCALPPPLQTAMKQAPMVVVELDIDARVEHTFNNYILHKLTEWRSACGETQGFARFADDLRQSLNNIRKRLGGARHQQLDTLLEHALREHQRGDSSSHRAWIRPLLEDYYDPMYDYQLERKADRVLFRGNRAQVRDFLLTRIMSQ